MKDLTVLVTAAGAQFMPGLAGCLKKNGERNIRIVGVDMSNDPSILQMVDAFYTVPSSSAADYADIIIDICKKEKVDVLIPFMSSELMCLSERRDDFKNAGVILSVADRQSFEVANNKLSLYDFMKKNGLTTPRYSSVKYVDELESVCRSLGYPEKAVCLKATESSGSRGIRIIDPKKSRYDILFGEKPNSFFISLEEMKIILSEKNSMPEMLAMEYLPGEEYSVDLIADRGRILYIAGRESNTILASIPQESTLREDKEAYKICGDVISALKLDGNADLDFKYDENGKPVLMEINPRIAATMAVFAVGGLNLPYLRVKQLLGEELPEINVKYGVKMKRRYLEMFTDKNGNSVEW